MTSQKLNKILNIIYPILSILLLVALWQVLYLTVGSDFIFPSVGATFTQMCALLTNGNFWLALLSTLGRVLLCVAIGFLMAVVVGTLSYAYKAVAKIIAPLMAIFRCAPTVAMMVICSIILPNSITPLIVGLLVVFPMLYASVNSALNLVDSELLQMCKLYNIPQKQRLKYLYIPTMLPYLLGELGATLSFTVKLIISAEILAYTYQSIGGLIQSANVYLDMPSLFALTILSIIFASLLDLLVGFLCKKLGGKKQ